MTNRDVALLAAGIDTGGGIACPRCGHVEGHRYIEDIQNFRQVAEVEDGVLKIHAFYETGEGFDDGDNGRLLCGNGECCEEFRVPDDMELDFI